MYLLYTSITSCIKQGKRISTQQRNKEGKGGDIYWCLREDFIGKTDAGAEAPYFGHLIRRADSLEKTLMLGKIEGRRQGGNRGWNGWMASLTQDSMDMSLRKFREIVMDREAGQPVACCAAVHGVTKNGTWLSDWKTTTTYIYKLNHFAVYQKLT